jgi:hypothetical protein
MQKDLHFSDEFCDLLYEWYSEHISVYMKEDTELWHESYDVGDWNTAHQSVL